jgi:DNA gyrase subunit A
LFFTTVGKVYWQKVYDLPQLARDSRGRAIINMLNLAEDEKIAECLVVRDFNLPGHFVMMATREGNVKKSPLEDYSRPKRGGIIAIKLREGDELVDASVVGPKDELIMVTASGMSIRFSESDARPMGRNTSGVRGVRLRDGDKVVGMVVADPEATLLTLCEHGYGKRTPFGPSTLDPSTLTDDPESTGETESAEPEPNESEAEESEESVSSSARYRTQRRGGKGVRDIQTTDRNGKVVGVARVDDNDEILMMTARGKLQRIAASDISIIGRNTKGVRIMSLDEDDTLIAVVRVPKEEASDIPVEGDAEAEG